MSAASKSTATVAPAPAGGAGVAAAPAAAEILPSATALLQAAKLSIQQD